MTYLDVNELRYYDKQLMPSTDLDSVFTFYYDETNNNRRFRVRESDFNCSFQKNFVLGGVVYDKTEPHIDKLFIELNLSSSKKEVKFTDLAHGKFLDCLRSHKLNYFLRYLLHNNIYIHYSNINLLYYSIVDIVDSACVSSIAAPQFDHKFSQLLKNTLYKLSKLEIDAVVNVFYAFEYPNIKKESVLLFINALIDIFENYEDTIEFHVGLTSLKQILKESKKEESLPFIMDEEDFLLLEDFLPFYLRPIYLFKNSTHIFDKEDFIENLINGFIIKDGDKTLKSYSFEDSKDNLSIQASDIVVGLVGRLAEFINTQSQEEIENNIHNLNAFQLDSLDIYLELANKSHTKNSAFLNPIDSFEEMSKVELLHHIRNK